MAKNSLSKILISLNKTFYPNISGIETYIASYGSSICMDSTRVEKNQPRIYSVILIS